jgi:flagellar basal body-associated protein FliL
MKKYIIILIIIMVIGCLSILESIVVFMAFSSKKPLEEPETTSGPTS